MKFWGVVELEFHLVNAFLLLPSTFLFSSKTELKSIVFLLSLNELWLVMAEFFLDSAYWKTFFLINHEKLLRPTSRSFSLLKLQQRLHKKIWNKYYNFFYSQLGFRNWLFTFSWDSILIIGFVRPCIDFFTFTWLFAERCIIINS